MARSPRSTPNPMNTSNLSLPKLPTCTIAQQYLRQRISDTWEPAGFDRYQYQRALLAEMSVLGGPDDHYGANPDRYSLS